jgi:hypothetical protein
MNQERIEDQPSYPQRLALLKNPKTPVHLSLQHIKFLHLFDLVSLCLQPVIPQEVKQAAEERIVAQIPKMPIGQRITLARRGPPRILAQLLLGENLQIIQAGLDNPYLTENILSQSLNRNDCPQKVVDSVATHKKWSTRYELRLALLRQSRLSMSHALKFIPDLKSTDLKELAYDPRVNTFIRNYLIKKLALSL